MTEITGIRFNSAGKIYYFSPEGMTLHVGDKVIVETSRGVEMGTVSLPNRNVEDSTLKEPLKPIVRLATEEDFRQVEENKEKEREAFDIAGKEIERHGLEMKLIRVEYTFDRSKILFYFTADGRVDFRELVKSLAGVFRTRIELRQIGVRDEAKHLGAFGICGRHLCCSSYLNDFQPVSIKMAKEQGLSLNPTKISGVCGRLMCCLQYEQEAYEDLLKSLPKVGASVSTPDGVGTVVDVNVLKGRMRVKIETAEGTSFGMYTADEVAPANGVAVPTKEPKETEQSAEEPAPVEESAPAEEKRDGKPHKNKKKPHRRNNKNNNSSDRQNGDGGNAQKRPDKKQGD